MKKINCSVQMVFNIIEAAGNVSGTYDDFKAAQKIIDKCILSKEDVTASKLNVEKGLYDINFRKEIEFSEEEYKLIKLGVDNFFKIALQQGKPLIDKGVKMLIHLKDELEKFEENEEEYNKLPEKVEEKTAPVDKDGVTENEISANENIK